MTKQLTGMLKGAENRLLTRAAQQCRRSATVRERFCRILFRQPASTRFREHGATLIEFALVAVLLCLLLLVLVDFGRMLLIYNSVAHAARTGVRYAIVHGDGAGSRVGSGPAADPSDVVAVVVNFAGSAPLNPALLAEPGAVAVTYTNLGGGGNGIGDLVEVTVTYPYDPLMGYFPLSFNLRARSQGRIAF